MAGAIVGIILVQGVLFGAVASGIWSSKGGSAGAGFALGFFLGLLGLIYMAAAKPAGFSQAKVTAASTPILPSAPNSGTASPTQRAPAPTTGPRLLWGLARPGKVAAGVSLLQGADAP